ncbi:hypothetical protein TNIN_11261 [Trichonephila inaurata madagascariensis]|uniref:Cadherin domain-containing protein n=1 Tax=Trichonephila inaurata madagascariensis TaxID=2747483 RepID=A0A8X6X4X2_9ARAC|nr:hypothetical protein TNIN_11261 [Trichonephila inaurata madagascariensis]
MSPDREETPVFTLRVLSLDSANNTTVCEVTVEVLDVNDEIAIFQHTYQGIINENASSGTPVTVYVLVASVALALTMDSRDNRESL